MTYNQILDRVRSISLAHKQVRNYFKGFPSDFITDHKVKYVSVFLEDNGGLISTTQGKTIVNFRLFILDLVHVSEGARLNEQDVHSDTLSIAEDLIAQMRSSVYTDWLFSTENNITFVTQEYDDLVAGVVIDINIATQFNSNTCVVPSDLIITPPTTDDMDKPTYYKEVIMPGGSSTYTDPDFTGKYMILIIRENNPLHPVSNLPASAEYVWDGTTVEWGAEMNPGERVLFVFRNS